MVDTLAGLRFAPEKDTDGKQGSRYADFVHEFFPSQYRTAKLGPRLWRGLRCRPLHNFSAADVALADSQSAGIHLQHETSGRVVLHWPEFLADYTAALESYWAALEDLSRSQAQCATSLSALSADDGYGSRVLAFAV